MIIFTLIARYLRLLLDGDPFTLFWSAVYLVVILTLFRI